MTLRKSRSKLRRAIRPALQRVPGARRLSARLRWASVRQVEPLSRWGFERGTPIDRWYIERFVTSHRSLVHGRVLEVLEDLYATRLGATHVDILDIDDSNPTASIVGDVCDSQTLPTTAFDAIVLTQTLQFVAEPRRALVNLATALKPGGVMLVTVPTVSRLGGEDDRWRWTPRGLKDLTAGLGCTSEVSGYGNLVTCRAFLMGWAVADLPASILQANDSAFPMLVTALLTKESAAGYE